jgi:hypothetical protein
MADVTEIQTGLATSAARYGADQHRQFADNAELATALGTADDALLARR